MNEIFPVGDGGDSQWICALGLCKGGGELGKNEFLQL